MEVFATSATASSCPHFLISNLYRNPNSASVTTTPQVLSLIHFYPVGCSFQLSFIVGHNHNCEIRRTIFIVNFRPLLLSRVRFQLKLNILQLLRLYFITMLSYVTVFFAQHFKKKIFYLLKQII